MRNLLLIVGPSGSGKSTLEKNLLQLDPDTYHKAISVTTRAPRKGEIDGVDYFFKTKETFNPDDMLETVEFAGNLYGLPLNQIHETKDTLVVVEPNGVVQIKKYIEKNQLDINVYIIYLDIPLKTRIFNMISSRSDDPKAVEERLSKDTIQEDFKKLGLRADLPIKKLNPHLHLHVHEWASLTKKMYL